MIRSNQILLYQQLSCILLYFELFFCACRTAKQPSSLLAQRSLTGARRLFFENGQIEILVEFLCAILHQQEPLDIFIMPVDYPFHGIQTPFLSSESIFPGCLLPKVEGTISFSSVVTPLEMMRRERRVPYYCKSTTILPPQSHELRQQRRKCKIVSKPRFQRFMVLRLIWLVFTFLVFFKSIWFEKIPREIDVKISHAILEEQKTTGDKVVVNDSISTSDLQKKIEGIAVLIFRFPNLSGQGTGNIMSGVLAAQLLAEEFNRTICHVGTEATSFHVSFRRAFEWKDDHHKEVCVQILRYTEQVQQNNTAIIPDDTIVQRNYDATSEQSECTMREWLSNHDGHPIIYYQGNTYPRWPNKATTLPRDHFHEQFRPTQALWDILPWKESNPPQTVIHLRQGDNDRDHREGLDELTLSQLEKVDFVPKKSNNPNPNVFLVTNNVELYSRFPEWSHPDWELVRHSALKRISWGEPPDGKPPTHRGGTEGVGDLQMWADWYTLLNAQKIYHTHSDFSRSAARWNERIQSWTILGSTEETAGTNGGGAGPRLLLRNDIEPVTNESKGVSRLVDRTTEELWFCGNPSPGEKQFVQEKKDRQLLDLIRARKRRTNSFG